MRACIATLLEIPILSVPDFTDIPDKPDADPDGYPEWYSALQNFVRRFGFSWVEIQMDKKTWMPLPNETLAIFVGPHASGCKHAIVGRCVDGGFYPAFDPLGEETAPFTTVEAVCLLVPVDPHIQIRMGRALEEIEATSRGVSNRIIGDTIRDTAREALGKQAFNTPTILGPNGLVQQLATPRENPILGPDGVSHARLVEPEITNAKE